MCTLRVIFVTGIHILLVRIIDSRGPPIGSRSATAIVPHVFMGCPDATCASCSFDSEEAALQTFCTACWPGFTLVDGNCVESEKGSWANGPTLDLLKPVVGLAKDAVADAKNVMKPLSFLAIQSKTNQNTTKQPEHLTGAAARQSNSTSGVLKKRVKLDLNQKVYIEGQLTIGNGEQGSFNKCNMFPSYMVDNANKPTVKVCGTHIKMEVFVYGECNAGYAGSGSQMWTIGICNTTFPVDHCETYSPNNDSTFGACQSWKATMC